MMSRFRLSFQAVGLAVFIASVWGLVYWFFPAPTLRIQEGETSIQFSASRGMVAFQHDCVMLSWDVFNTLGVVVNGELLPTPSEKMLCITPETQPTLTVTRLDGTESRHTLRVGILTNGALFLGSAGVALLALAGAVVSAIATAGRLWERGLFVRGVRVGLGVIVSAWLAWQVVDWGLTQYFRTFGTREQKVMFVYTLDEIRALDSTLLHAPYVSYLPNPDYEGHNALGYRGEEIALPKPEGTFRIVALGGSTTYSTGTTAQESYPALLQKILREEYGLSQVEVVNAGMLGYTSWEALTTFAFRALELEPDMVIYYEGVNDLVVRERSTTDCFLGENALRGLNPIRGLFVERAAAYTPNALNRLVGITFGTLQNPLTLDSAFEPTRIPCEGDEGDMTIDRRLEANTPYYYVKNVRNIALLAQANGVQPILSSWVYNTLADRPALWREAIAEQNLALAEMAEANGIPFYDLVATFPEDNALWEADGIHMVANGTREQATQYARFLVENGFIR